MTRPLNPEQHPRFGGYENPFVAEYYDALWVVRDRTDLDFYLECVANYVTFLGPRDESSGSRARLWHWASSSAPR